VVFGRDVVDLMGEEKCRSFEMAGGCPFPVETGD